MTQRHEGRGITSAAIFGTTFPGIVTSFVCVDRPCRLIIIPDLMQASNLGSVSLIDGKDTLLSALITASSASLGGVTVVAWTKLQFSQKRALVLP